MRTLLSAALALALVGAASGAPSARQSAVPRDASTPPTIVDLLDQYWHGNLDVVTSRFATGAAVASMVAAVRAWADSPAARMWRQASLVLTVDLAAAALTLPEPAPAAAAELLELGRKEVLRRLSRDETSLPGDFVRTWLETAVALQVAAGADAQALESIRAVIERRDGDESPRLWLSQGIATELSGGPDRTRAFEDAVRAYDRAARDPAIRAEASARAALALIRLARYRDAIRRLDIAGDGTEDVLVASWLAYLRGLAQSGSGEGALALAAHEQALSLMPGAAPAYAGRAVALRLLKRADDSPAAPPGASDPWAALERGDRRAIEEGVRRLRSSLDTLGAAAAPARPAVFETLDQYDRAEHAAVIQALLAMKSLESFSSDVRDFADPWVLDAPPSATAGRQRVVAIVTLEAARARGLSDWPLAHQLMEWACARLRAAPQPDDFERRWLHAAAAVMAGAVQAATMEVHVTHALARFPGDAALVMDRAVAAELRAGPDVRSPSGLRPPDGRLDLVMSRMQQAAEHAEYRSEAYLRMGYTALRRGSAEDALRQLALPAESPDPAIRYLAQLFRGRAFDRLNRPDDAVRAYEAAVAVVPGAQTAEIALAAALARTGEYGRGADAAERALGRAETIQDPWLYYGQGDFRNWPRIIAGLREDAR